MKKISKALGVAAFAAVIGILMLACPEPDTTHTPNPTVIGVSVSAAGGAISVAKGATLQFNAVVTGTNSPAQTVTWTIDEEGKETGTTINAAGLLTVAAGESQSSLTIRATSTVDASKSGTATVTVTTAGETPTVTNVTVSAAGNASSVAKGATLQFNAAVTGTNSPAQTVTWSIDTTGIAAGTSISTAGLLTVAANESLTSLTIRATSTVDTSKSGTATVTVTTADETPIVTNVTVSAAGNASSVTKGTTLQFNAVVDGTNNPAQTVTWTIDELGKDAGTTINAAGLLTVAAGESQSSLTIRATSTVDTQKYGTATVTVTASHEQGFEFGIISGSSIITDMDHDPEAKTIVAQADSTFTNFKWYIDNVPVQTGNNELTITAPELVTGYHTLTVEAQKDGRPYATTVFYRVN